MREPGCKLYNPADPTSWSKRFRAMYGHEGCRIKPPPVDAHEPRISTALTASQGGGVLADVTNTGLAKKFIENKMKSISSSLQDKFRVNNSANSANSME